MISTNLPHALSLINVRSIKTKSASFIEYVRDSNADLNVSTSTGLTVDDIAASLEIIPNGYKLINHTRTKLKGGGITLLHTDCHSITVLNIKCVEESSFEISELIVKFESFSMKLVIIYRPPYSTNHPVTVRTFTTEFTAYLIIVFNIHVDDSNDAYAVGFLDMLESMGFMQHVDVPTHEQGHTLDLVITRNSSQHFALIWMNLSVVTIRHCLR